MPKDPPKRMGFAKVVSSFATIRRERQANAIQKATQELGTQNPLTESVGRLGDSERGERIARDRASLE